MIYMNTGVSAISAAVRLCVAGVAAGLLSSASAAPATTRVIVEYKAGTYASIKTLIAAAQGAVKHEIFDSNAVAIEIPTIALEAFKRNRFIESVEVDAKRYPLGLDTPSGTPYLPGQKVPYGIKMVQADKLPDTNAANRMVCIIDSGYDRAHEDLGGNQVTGEFDKGTGWWYTDENSHGTHVAGTIAAINNNGTGVVGVHANRRLKLHIVKVFGADGWAYASTLASAAKKCAKAGANIISMSLGGADPTWLELRTFAALERRGVLSIAAAGNDGNDAISFPAGYSSVMMVGALDENKVTAPFSQFNHKVEITGPGVGVLSTVPMNTGSESALKVGATAFAAGAMDGSPRATVTAPLADFGIGDALNPAMAGKVCLIARGSIAFGVKVANCQSSGGVGAIVFNNVPEAFGGTLGDTVTTIPSVTAAGSDGAALKAHVGQMASVSVKPVSYAYFNGTSMATPHVSAVAALVWSYFPSCNGEQIRSSLIKSALDLGDPGRDDNYGHGLVQAKAAYDRIASAGCGN